MICLHLTLTDEQTIGDQRTLFSQTCEHTVTDEKS